MTVSIRFLAAMLVMMGAFMAVQAQPGADDTKEKPVLREPESRRYKLNPGDVLEVIYRYTPEFNQTVTIHPDGHVVLQIAGDLEIGGLTLPAAKALILEKASERLNDPEMTLLLKEFQKPYYVVSGEVTKPGRFEMDEEITALQAVMLAGGFNDRAKTSKVVVFRKINKDFAKVMILDLKKVRKTSDLESDMNLLSGDIVFIPRNKFSKFERFIRLTSLASILNPIVR